MYETTLICHRPLASGYTDLMFKRHQTRTSLLIISWLKKMGVGWSCRNFFSVHDNVIKWKHFPRYWPFVRRIHRSSLNPPPPPPPPPPPHTHTHKGQWRGALIFSLISAWINGWVNNCEAGDLRLHRPLWRHCNALITIQTNHTEPSNYILGKSYCERI